jgi:hypothetical protein
VAAVAAREDLAARAQAVKRDLAAIAKLKAQNEKQLAKLQQVTVTGKRQRGDADLIAVGIVSQIYYDAQHVPSPGGDAEDAWVREECGIGYCAWCAATELEDNDADFRRLTKPIYTAWLEVKGSTYRCPMCRVHRKRRPLPPT